MTDRYDEFRCPKCGAPASTRSIRVDVLTFVEPPAQVEPYVRVTQWQCLRTQAHRGTHREPSA